MWKLVRGIKSELKDVPTSVSKILDAEKKIRLYDDVVNAPKGSVAAYQSIPSSTNGIKSWAFDDDFKFKSPCTRCQRLYLGWHLHKKPNTPEEKLARLREDYGVGSLKYSPGNKYPCGYCAETVAAAKLHALYHGTLTLILPKDKDEIKASDEVRKC